jgi:protein SCO1/2
MPRCAVLALWILVAALMTFGCRREPELQRFGKIADFALIDQSGAQFGSAELRGHVWIAAFMFTRCPTVCPRITARMSSLQRELQQRDADVRFVSFSVDPDHDTPEVLRRYASQHGAETSTWRFVTGDYEALKKTIVEGFKIALEGKAQEGAEHYGILHGSQLVLVGPDGTIRGYYGTADDAEVNRLRDDATRLARGGA